MKKYVFLTTIALLLVSTSCDTDSETPSISTSNKTNNLHMQKENDSTEIDTGGQGGSTPIKP